ncbi:MAG: GNAT family N-acetyltransferase, partial [Alphaproteobacteria bacterium]
MNGTTRLYRPSDEDAVISVWRAASEIAHHFLTDAFFADEERRIREIYLLNAETWVFEQQAAIVGFVALVGDEVGGLFVHPKSQRLGIGTALMDLAVNRRGEIFLDVFKA